MSSIGRRTQIVDCRETGGLGLGGSLAQRGTLAEAAEPNVLVLSMGPTARHITKPVCEITYALREAGFQTSVLVLNAGIGPCADRGGGHSAASTIMPLEEKQMAQYRLAILHQGNIPSHFTHKALNFLRNVEIPTIVVCQAPVEQEAYAKVGVRTWKFEPKQPKTKGYIVDIVSGVVRGETCPRHKLDEIITKLNYWYGRLYGNGKSPSRPLTPTDNTITYTPEKELSSGDGGGCSF